MPLPTYIILFLLLFFAILFFVYLRLRNLAGVNPVSGNLEDYEVLEIQISKSSEPVKDLQLNSLAAEHLFSSLHGLLKEDPGVQEHFSFEIVSSGKTGIKFYMVVPRAQSRFIESQVYAQYPAAQVRIADDVAQEKIEDYCYEVAAVTLKKPNFFPIKGFRDFETDPLSSFTSSMTSVGDNEEIRFQILVRPIADVWQKEGHKYVESVRAGKPLVEKSPNPLTGIFNLLMKEMIEIASGVVVGMFTMKASSAESSSSKPNNYVPPPPKLSAIQDLELKAIDNKLTKMGYEVVIRVVASAPSDGKVRSHLEAVLASMKQYSTTNLNSFGSSLDINKAVGIEHYRKRFFDSEKSFILDAEELATIFHFPSASLDTPNISWVYSKKSEPPSNLPTEDCNYIGYTTYRNKKVKFGIKNNDDRLRHMYLIGKSGTGKSTLFETMISQDIKNGAGVGVLDPHGETIDKVLERIPDNRVDDIIYFDPSDSEYPLGLNLLEMTDQSQKNLMASGLVSAIKQHFEYSWGPRLEYLLNYAMLTLLEVPGTTMLGITRLMEDQNYLKYILHQVKDPMVVKFWEKEFKEMKGNQKLVTEAIAPIQNKVNRFLASTTIRNILGQRYSTLNLWEAMNSGKIVLMNLSKGKIGSDNANLLGALLVSRIQFFALQRAKIPERERRPFYLYVDEFQNFASGSFEEILSESRKYKLGLYLTHQFTAQLPENILKAVFGNVGTIATFALGAPDAKVLATEFQNSTPEDIISLERFYVYIKMMVDGMTSHPFSARILVPWEEENFEAPKTTNREKVIDLSRQKYGVQREYVESKINKWVEANFDKGLAISQGYKAPGDGTVNNTSAQASEAPAAAPSFIPENDDPLE